MFYSFQGRNLNHVCNMVWLMREACFNLGRGDGKGCKGIKVRFNSVQEE